MSRLFPVIAGISGTIAIGSAGAYLLLIQQKTIRDSFKDAIINFETETELIKEKLKKLSSSEALPKGSIFEIAQTKEKGTKDSGFEEFKAACKKIYESNFTNKESKEFKNFQNYCARTIKDKVTSEKWATGEAKWDTRLNKLKGNNPKALSNSLKSLDTQNKDNLKNWCTKVESFVFEGENNLEFKDAKEYCKKED